MSLVRTLCALFVLLMLLSMGCNSDSVVTAQSARQGDETALAQVGERSVVDSTFDDIKFDMEKTQAFDRSMLTPKVEELFGRQIRIRGYMFPTLKKKGLKQFVLVRDNLECCFGPGAALFDCILVHMKEGRTAEYSIRPIAVEGTFSLDEVVGPDSNHLAIYRLDGDAIE
ncbi:MAG: DUF3299 domain-containing protein [Planctomycetales bacterium]|nr:DUF3299 domain-containing protein [Planctomycetales bacterium]